MTTTIITTAEALKQGNSITNQEIKGKIIARDVYVNVSAILDTMSRNECFDLYEEANMTPTAEIEGVEYTEEEAQERIDKLTDIIVSQEEKEDIRRKENKLIDLSALLSWEHHLDVLKSHQEELESADYDNYPEVLEYWSINRWFGEQLEKNGQVVFEFEGHTIWGRCTSGQAILLDHVITLIAVDMKILEGQENDWSA